MKDSRYLKNSRLSLKFYGPPPDHHSKHMISLFEPKPTAQAKIKFLNDKMAWDTQRILIIYSNSSFCVSGAIFEFDNLLEFNHDMKIFFVIFNTFST